VARKSNPKKEIPLPEPESGEEEFVVQNLNFKFDSFEILPEGKRFLDMLSEYLLSPPVFKKLKIVGHTDSVGKAAYNLHLSQKRAQAVKKYLVSVRKLKSKKIIALGRGEEEPIADNGNFQGREDNRRVELSIDR